MMVMIKVSAAENSERRGGRDAKKVKRKKNGCNLFLREISEEEEEK
jgi:hypothetical protein